MGVAEPVKRDGWARPAEFILACLGYAVGFGNKKSIISICIAGNVWRFPYLCGRNGGAAFLVPYFIVMILAGFPLFYMELALGQYAQCTPVILYGKMAPAFTGLGMAMILAQTYTVRYNDFWFSKLLLEIFLFCKTFVTQIFWTMFQKHTCYRQDRTLYSHGHHAIIGQNFSPIAWCYLGPFKMKICIECIEP